MFTSSRYYSYRNRVHNPKFSHHVTVDVTEEPITLAQACAQVNQEVGIDDTYVSGLIPVARQYVENYTGECLCLRTIAIMYDEFPFPFGEMVLPFGPLNSITSIQYEDFSQTVQTLSASLYRVDKYSPLGSAYLPLFNFWPIQICQSHSVTVTGVFGFGTVASGLIPPVLVHAVKLAIAHFYNERVPIIMGLVPSTIPHGLEALMHQYRTNWI